MKLPKDLEVKRKKLEVSYDDTSYGDHSRGFDAGVTAVLEHEQIKKLEEDLEYISSDLCIDNQDFARTARKALADFRAWRDRK